MKIDTVTFGRSFVERAVPRLEAQEIPLDSVDLSRPDAFRQLTLALAAATAPIPLLAALSQEVAQSLVTRAQEESWADTIEDQYRSLPHLEDERVQQAWEKVREVTGSTYPAPQVLDSLFIDAQSDSREMYLGKASLGSDMADENVLLFTLAHEEGHRVHRDSAGARGLEAFHDACPDDRLGLLVLREGRHQNEREADRFAARVVAQLGCDPQPILNFLTSLNEDLQHPDGDERAAAVRAEFEKARSESRSLR